MNLVHFKVQELVDKATFDRLGVDAITLFDPRILEIAEGLRTFFNAPMTINNWLWGGNLQNRGLRGPECTIGAPKSYHKVGKALDCDIQGFTAAELREEILRNQDAPELCLIQRMEADVSWLHVDVGDLPSGKSRIYVFKG